MDELDKHRLTVMANLIESNVAWHELEGLTTSALVVLPRANGVWRCHMFAAQRGIERRLSVLSRGALNAAAQSRTDVVFTSANARRARNLVQQGIEAFYWPGRA